jgi:hypothetical protein
MSSSKVNQEPILATLVSIDETGSYNSLESKLRELDQARCAELITEAEFAACKEKLLVGMITRDDGGSAVLSTQPLPTPLLPSYNVNVHPKARNVSGPMVLVHRGSPMALVVSDHTGLRSGATVQFTLLSHPGLSIGKKYPGERRFGEWRYIESDVNTSPVMISWENR